jgi:hypothetical protein
MSVLAFRSTAHNEGVRRAHLLPNALQCAASDPTASRCTHRQRASSPEQRTAPTISPVRCRRNRPLRRSTARLQYRGRAYHPVGARGRYAQSVQVSTFDNGVSGTGKLIHVGILELIHLDEGIMVALSGYGLVRGIYANQDTAQARQEPSRNCL